MEDFAVLEENVARCEAFRTAFCPAARTDCLVGLAP
jgi:hypothetical protein